MADQDENQMLLDAGFTEEEIQLVRSKMGTQNVAFEALVSTLVRVQQLGIPQEDVLLAWRLAQALRANDSTIDDWAWKNE